MSQTILPKRALISVSKKTGIVEFSKKLHELGVEIISTGGTARLLTQNNIPNVEISDYTGFPEMMDGRVKTLHPKVHGGLLGLRDEHLEVAKANNIDWIDIVVCNLYPFEETTKKPNVTFEEIIENIDIGGPSMIRSGSKNFKYVTTIVDPSDYQKVIEEMEKDGITYKTRQKLAIKAFGHTAEYDTFIHNYLDNYTSNNQDDNPTKISFSFSKEKTLRYGENPNQKAAIYRQLGKNSPILDAKIHQGIELSYNNTLDAEAGYTIAREYKEPTCVVIKHTNPCGVATHLDINTAFERAYAADSLSAFGGIIAINRECTKEIATSITKVFAEIVIAPSYTKESLEILSKKKKLRVIEINNWEDNNKQEYKFIEGGLMVQEANNFVLTLDKLELKTQTEASQEDLQTAIFGWSTLKHVKSNGILLAKDNTTVGIGMGQVSRVDAVNLAISKAGNKVSGSVLLSDAFFPFRDSVDMIAKHGIKTIIQPGGSIKDKSVIEACNEHGIAMYFTGTRCFKH